MSTKEQFEQAALQAQKLPNQSNESLLNLYGLYKQASQGDVSGSRPGTFDFRGRAKYDAWAKLKGMSKDDAMQAYINLVDGLAKS